MQLYKSFIFSLLCRRFPTENKLLSKSFKKKSWCVFILSGLHLFWLFSGFNFFWPQILSGLHLWWHLIGFVFIRKWESITHCCWGVWHHSDRFWMLVCWQLFIKRKCVQMFELIRENKRWGCLALNGCTMWLYWIDVLGLGWGGLWLNDDNTMFWGLLIGLQPSTM